ncbi:SPFH domain-containing protein [Desulfosarcina cetonica]|uniref:SPFH domain-containing protein n=1 Tax=Desulfosarcina cetonica TaxID=90730 RepID=UPI000B228C5B|nr:SPFH domain-containing protein [Desulfosarcina cetonica]
MGYFFNMFNLMNIFVVAGVILVAMVVIGMILARLYRRATKEVSFVRTGFGGQKVILNGGALVLPVLHDTIPVNMNTLRLEVQRANQQALITRDRMRVDVMAEFYVRVKPTQDAIANAAQTLGLKTMNPDELKALVEGKFVDALRAVAAEMAMEELHEQRVDFVQKVQQVVSEDLLKNGLELESVSLTGLDQTGKEYFNPDNAFDAEGLTKLTEAIEERRKKRNDIEQDTEVAIANKNLEAQRKKYDISREQEYARLEQEREVEIRRAAQAAEIKREQAEKTREPSKPKSRPSSRSTWLTSKPIGPSRKAASKRIGSSRSGISPGRNPLKPPRSSAARPSNWPSRIAPSPLPRNPRPNPRPRPSRPCPLDGRQGRGSRGNGARNPESRTRQGRGTGRGFPGRRTRGDQDPGGRRGRKDVGPGQGRSRAHHGQRGRRKGPHPGPG